MSSFSCLSFIQTVLKEEWKSLYKGYFLQLYFRVLPKVLGSGKCGAFHLQGKTKFRLEKQMCHSDRKSRSFLRVYPLFPLWPGLPVDACTICVFPLLLVGRHAYHLLSFCKRISSRTWFGLNGKHRRLLCSFLRWKHSKLVKVIFLKPSFLPKILKFYLFSGDLKIFTMDGTGLLEHRNRN